MTEPGIKLNNVLTGLLLMVASWVGWNIEEIKRDLHEDRTAIAVNKVKLEAQGTRLSDHIANDKAHFLQGTR